MGIACWAVISIAFAVCRRNAAFAVVSVAAIGAFAYLDASAADAAVTGFVVALGLTTYVVGLLFVRSMIHRSISLDMLLARATGDRADFDALVAARVGETVTYRLATFDGREYRLTAFGRLIALGLGLAYRATGLTE
jgi:hypothetical protein